MCLGSCDTYIFGNEKSKNILSIGEMSRLSGADFHYYEQTNKDTR